MANSTESRVTLAAETLHYGTFFQHKMQVKLVSARLRPTRKKASCGCDYSEVMICAENKKFYLNNYQFLVVNLKLTFSISRLWHLVSIFIYVCCHYLSMCIIAHWKWLKLSEHGSNLGNGNHLVGLIIYKAESAFPHLEQNKLEQIELFYIWI